MNDSIPVELNTPEIPKKHTARNVLISVLIIVLVAGFIYFMYFSAKKFASQKVLTPEDKVKILDSLDSNPPADGSVKMTEAEKLKALSDLNKASSSKTGKASQEDQDKVLRSVQ